MIIWDLLGYASLFWRDFEKYEYTRYIAHYLAWSLISDLNIILVPKNKRYWWSIFRFMGGAANLYYTICAWFLDIDGDENFCTGVRVVLQVVRMVWGLVYLIKYGPHLAHWMTLLHNARERFNHGKWY